MSAPRALRAAAVLALALLAGGCARGARDAAPASAIPWSDPDSVADAYVDAGGALFAPGATRGFWVDPRGDLYDGEARLAFAPAADGAPAGPPLRIAAPERWRPLLRWVRRAGEVRWEFEAVAFPQQVPRESVLTASLLVRARNTGARPHDVELRASLVPWRDADPFVAWDAARPELRWADSGSRDTARAWAEKGAAGEAFEDRVTLAPGESHEVRLLFAAYGTPARALEKLADEPHAACVAQVCANWDEQLSHGAAFTLGDPETERALRAAAIVLLACRERRGDGWVPTGGPFHYRDVWLRDGARLAQALAVSGHAPEAHEALEGLARFQWPGGAYLSQRGQLDGTGQALWAAAEVLGRAPRAPHDAPFADAGLRAWRWLAHQRAAARAARGGPGALLPFGEPRDNELVRAELVGNDAWAIAGERALARLLRAMDRAAEADSVAREADAAAADFRAALAARGAREVPPSWQGRGRDWGNLLVGWPLAVLPPGDARVAATARRVWATAGGAGLVTYGARDSLHLYIGADLATWALLAGERAAADSVLQALLDWRTASGTAGEVFARDGHAGRNLPPHPTSAAALVTLVRNALVFDDGDTLRLTLGARPAWWRGASVKRAPTWWGPLDLEFARAGERASWAWTPVPVWTALTLPPGTRLAEPPAAPLVAGPRGEVVFAPPGARAANVALAASATR